MTFMATQLLEAVAFSPSLNFVAARPYEELRVVGFLCGMRILPYSVQEIICTIRAARLTSLRSRGWKATC